MVLVKIIGLRLKTNPGFLHKIVLSTCLFTSLTPPNHSFCLAAKSTASFIGIGHGLCFAEFYNMNLNPKGEQADIKHPKLPAHVWSRQPNLNSVLHQSLDHACPVLHCKKTRIKCKMKRTENLWETCTDTRRIYKLPTKWPQSQ